jgi:hypothetical protein
VCDPVYSRIRASAWDWEGGKSIIVGSGEEGGGEIGEERRRCDALVGESEGLRCSCGSSLPLALIIMRDGTIVVRRTVP